jgi:FkbM family methyltransferase
MSTLRNTLIKVSGNQFIQRLLEKNVQASQYLMGIGSGAGVMSSGEQTALDFLQRKVRPPYCIFDVGSNKGQFLQLTLENLATNNFNIHCFEPSHETFQILLKSLKKDDRIMLNNFALGKEKDQAILYYDKPGSGLASLTKRKLDHFNIDFKESENVVIATIDDYCLENSIDHIHLLKIDIEGHELDALAGAKAMFEANCIDIVTFEFGG